MYDPIATAAKTEYEIVAIIIPQDSWVHKGKEDEKACRVSGNFALRAECLARLQDRVGEVFT